MPLAAQGRVNTGDGTVHIHQFREWGVVTSGGGGWMIEMTEKGNGKAVESYVSPELTLTWCCHSK